MNSGHPDEIDEDLCICIRQRRYWWGEAEPGRLQVAIAQISRMTANPTEMIAIHNDDDEDWPNTANPLLTQWSRTTG